MISQVQNYCNCTKSILSTLNFMWCAGKLRRLRAGAKEMIKSVLWNPFLCRVVQLSKISWMTSVMYTKIEEKVNTKSGRLDSTEKGSARLNTASLNYRVLKTEYLMLTVWTGGCLNNWRYFCCRREYTNSDDNRGLWTYSFIIHESHECIG